MHTRPTRDSEAPGPGGPLLLREVVHLQDVLVQRKPEPRVHRVPHRLRVDLPWEVPPPPPDVPLVSQSRGPTRGATGRGGHTWPPTSSTGRRRTLGRGRLGEDHQGPRRTGRRRLDSCSPAPYFGGREPGVSVLSRADVDGVVQ